MAKSEKDKKQINMMLEYLLDNEEHIYSKYDLEEIYVKAMARKLTEELGFWVEPDAGGRKNDININETEAQNKKRLIKFLEKNLTDISFEEYKAFRQIVAYDLKSVPPKVEDSGKKLILSYTDSEKYVNALCEFLNIRTSGLKFKYIKSRGVLHVWGIEGGNRKKFISLASRLREQNWRDLP